MWKLTYFAVYLIVAVTAPLGITVLKEVAAEAIELDEEVAVLSESESSEPISTRVKPGANCTLLKQYKNRSQLLTCSLESVDDVIDVVTQ